MMFQGNEPIDVIQAQSVYNQALKAGAADYHPNVMRDAQIALGQATNFARGGKTSQAIDYAQRSLELSGTALRDTQKQLAEKAAAEAAAEAAARRAAEKQALEQQTAAAREQAAQAEQNAAAARQQALEAREQAVAAREQLAAAQNQLADQQAEFSALQEQSRNAMNEARLAEERAAAAGMTAEAAEAAREEADAARRRADEMAAEVAVAASAVESQKRDLERRAQELQTQVASSEARTRELEAKVTQSEADLARVRSERDALAGQLSGALSEVATISQTARGVVVNLPDILFDTNKATLKPDAQVTLAKLAGILTVFSKTNMRVEGHTDSTGSDALNMRLSKDRALTVFDFLKRQGISEKRMAYDGYGPKFPVADNATPDGRAKNRRVEVIIAEGMIPGM
jgi:outer membrane protein OmpA-like peptidoglycan-associated protein